MIASVEKYPGTTHWIDLKLSWKYIPYIGDVQKQYPKRTFTNICQADTDAVLDKDAFTGLGQMTARMDAEAAHAADPSRIAENKEKAQILEARLNIHESFKHVRIGKLSI